MVSRGGQMAPPLHETNITFFVSLKLQLISVGGSERSVSAGVYHSVVVGSTVDGPGDDPDRGGSPYRSPWRSHQSGCPSYQ